jgi:glycosyltransferase involved in cell wall biosynthesis
MKITYGITVCNEHEELISLIDHLYNVIDDEDEILILRDMSNTSDKVTLAIIEAFKMFPNQLVSIDFNLNHDFATFKNKLIEHASGDILFQLDSDEIPHNLLIGNIKSIIDNTPDSDVFCVPRVNTVTGITQEHVKRWGWVLDDKNRINYPDYQMRIFRLNKGIKWKNKVHEVLDGYQSISHIPCIEDDELSLFHKKTIQKQEQQNLYYNTL